MYTQVKPLGATQALTPHLQLPLVHVYPSAQGAFSPAHMQPFVLSHVSDLESHSALAHLQASVTQVKPFRTSHALTPHLQLPLVQVNPEAQPGAQGTENIKFVCLHVFLLTFCKSIFSLQNLALYIT